MYSVHASPAVAEQLKELNFVESVIEAKYERGVESDRVFPNAEGYDWSLDNFGPLQVPKKGESISITPETLGLYGDLIRLYEGHKEAAIKEGVLTIDGSEVKEYTFQQNYYFMMGDNRHNSQDSRIWGFVPEDHILGKGVLVWFSISDDPEKNLFQRIRWERIFKVIE